MAAKLSTQFTKVAFVSGAAGGIGRAISVRLARDGMNIALSDVRPAIAGLQDVAEEVRALGRKAIIMPADVTSQSEVEAAVQSTASELGSMDVMVANAGMVQVKALTELTSAEFSREIGVNLVGVFNQYAAAARQMIKQGRGGKILGTASMAAHRGTPLMSAYSASKFGVRGLTQAAARELAKHNIIVNAYCPGYVDTNMWGSMDSTFAKYYGGEPGENRKRFEAEVPLGRPSQPEDVAKLVSYLAGDECDYITGQSLLVDGGSIMI